MAADDNTLVVSWNDAAEIQLCTPNDALVIPNKVGEDVAGCASRNSTSFLSFLRRIEFSSLTSRRLTICPARSLPESPISVPLSYQRCNHSLLRIQIYQQNHLQGILYHPDQQCSPYASSGERSLQCVCH